MKSRFLKILFGVLFSLSSLSPLFADNFSNNFQDHLNEKSLDALAQDLGALMGGGSFHQGKALGFPLGFDVGVHMPVLGVQKDNEILKDDSSTANALWGQAELGLPGKFNVIGRVGSMEDADMIGGGLRYGLLNPSLPGLPSLSVSALYNKMEHDFFEAETFSANMVLSVDFPFIHPYVGVGADTTEVDPTSLAFAGSPATVDRNVKGKSGGYRVEGGINLSLIPFTYISVGAGLANGQELYHVGAGVQF